MIEKINKIEKVRYSGFVYNLEVEPTHDTKDDQYYLNADTGFVVHNCHPRDNIALRHLADKLDLGYDLFDAIMNAREIQAKNLAEFIYKESVATNLPVFIHGKAYKPDVAYLEGSYSLLIGHYLEEFGANPTYIDPLTEGKFTGSVTGVVLLAHNRKITYGYAGEANEQELYCEIASGCVIIDPWRQYSTNRTDIKVIHYGNSRKV